MIILACLMIVFALAAVLIFQGSVLCGIGMFFFAAGILVSRIILGKKGKEALVRGIAAVCILGYLACGFFAGSRSAGADPADYEAEVARIQTLIHNDELKEAKKAVKELEKNYGETDESFFLNVQTLLQEGNITEATEALDSFHDLDAALYYLMRAESFKLLAKEAAESGRQTAERDEREYLNQMKNILVEGAKKNPDDFLLNFKAGCLFAADKEYTAAEYYLMQAYILGGEADSFTPYELACVYDEMGDVTKTYIMMAIAEERGAAEIKEYREDPLYPWYLETKKNLAQEEK